jgi:hypothetical protein
MGRTLCPFFSSFPRPLVCPTSIQLEGAAAVASETLLFDECFKRRGAVAVTRSPIGGDAQGNLRAGGRRDCGSAPYTAD